MRAVEVRYEKTHNLGNYESEKVGVTIALSDGDSAQGALEKAKLFCTPTQNESTMANENKTYLWE